MTSCQVENFVEKEEKNTAKSKAMTTKTKTIRGWANSTTFLKNLNEYKEKNLQGFKRLSCFETLKNKKATEKVCNVCCELLKDYVQTHCHKKLKTTQVMLDACCL